MLFQYNLIFLTFLTLVNLLELLHKGFPIDTSPVKFEFKKFKYIKNKI